MYKSGKTKEALVKWVHKRLYGAVATLSSVDQVTKFKGGLAAEGGDETAVVGIFGPDDTAAAAVFETTALEDNVRSYAKIDPSLSSVFEASAPSMVLLVTFAPGQVVMDLSARPSAESPEDLQAAMSAFIGLEKNPAVISFTSAKVSEILKPVQNKSVLLFGGDDKLNAAYAEIAKTLKDKYLFVHVDVANEDSRLRSFVGAPAKVCPRSTHTSLQTASQCLLIAYTPPPPPSCSAHHVDKSSNNPRSCRSYGAIFL